ncbi:related to C6 transcription factor [Rhynchosporium graminicola]|uniref:Related to C6 transcription factor n=1 Tax=Rhynchosporium graminicola TaxID=2792576 RepID=A0A1E1KG91_9HELO|nr:related to C6 transcription factor [Rhynchosporium commune]
MARLHITSLSLVILRRLWSKQVVKTNKVYIAARSNSGCWTCRVRKKKCDENRPHCSTCTSLAIQCYGYHERPAWMDNGPLQKKQALKIKRIVGQNNHRRRQSRSLQSSHLPFPGMDVLDKESLETRAPVSADSATIPTAEISAFSSSFEEVVSGDWDQYDSWTTSDADFSIITPVDISSNKQLNFDQLGWGEEFLPPNTSNGVKDFITAEFTGSYNYSDSYNDPLTSTSAKANNGHLSTFSETLATGLPFSQAPSNMEIILGDASPSTATIDDPVPPAEFDDGLVMHYLDEVFHLQFPFYNVSNRRSRGWLFSTMRRTQAVYHAALALSQYHFEHASYHGLTLLSPRKGRYHELAQRSLKIIQGETGKSSTLPRITCVLQSLFYELFTGGTKEWQHQLRLAGILLPPFVKTLSGSSNVQPREDTGLQVTVGALIFFDIIASTSTRSEPSINFDHRQIMNELGINMQSLFGCSNRIIELILDIAYLDSWKKECEKNRRLSVVELVKRGAKIEEDLRQYIDNVETENPLGNILTKATNSYASSAHTEITHIFALAAHTYLHVVISGAHCELREIADSVSQTVNAFKVMSDPQLLRNLVWPFCVTGCLASREKQPFFRELISAAGITSSTLGTCWQAFEIIEECWEARKTTSYNCDWAFVMNRRSCHILLV